MPVSISRKSYICKSLALIIRWLKSIESALRPCADLSPRLHYKQSSSHIRCKYSKHDHRLSYDPHTSYLDRETTPTISTTYCHHGSLCSWCYCQYCRRASYILPTHQYAREEPGSVLGRMANMYLWHCGDWTWSSMCFVSCPSTFQYVEC